MHRYAQALILRKLTELGDDIQSIQTDVGGAPQVSVAVDERSTHTVCCWHCWYAAAATAPIAILVGQGFLGANPSTYKRAPPTGTHPFEPNLLFEPFPCF